MKKRQRQKSPQHAHVRARERVRERALRDLETLKYEGGGFGGGWTHAASVVVRSLTHTRKGKGQDDFTSNLRRIVVVLRVLAFLLLSVWFIWWMANR